MSSCNIVKIFLFSSSIIVTMVWPQLLIETKKQELLQICKHECNGLQDLLVVTLKIAQKIKIMIALIHYLLIK